jgi:monoamine oxidase
MSDDFRKTDVVIIGAGASGLAAAARLAHAGRKALVLEARERVGGRIWSLDEPGLPVPVELGAEFIHGRAESTFSVLAKAGSAAVDRRGERWALRDGKLAPSQDLFAQISVALKRSRALDRNDMGFDVFLERHLRDELSAEARAFARLFAQGFDAADTRRASARAIVEEWTAGASVEGPQFRPLNGYGTLCSALVGAIRGSSVDVQLNTVVTAVRWSRGSVKVTGTFLGRPFQTQAKRAIITLPLGVLQLRRTASGAVRFTPALTAKRDALKLLAPGPVLKVLLRFKRAFWEELDGGRYRDVAFFRARDAAFPTLWTPLPVRTPMLVAWAAGPKAQRLAGADKPSIISEAMKSVHETFGPHPEIDSTFESAWTHDWQSDPYARGAYSYVLVNGGKAREQLAKPLLGTLFFAGEAADTDEAGTVEGALRSGERAAKEVLAAKK